MMPLEPADLAQDDVRVFLHIRVLHLPRDPSGEPADGDRGFRISWVISASWTEAAIFSDWGELVVHAWMSRSASPCSSGMTALRSPGAAWWRTW